MSTQAVARRYASALADVIAARSEEVTVRTELDGWSRMIAENKLLVEAFSNPTVPYEKKREVLEQLIARTGVADTTANFLRVLLRNQRLAELPQVNAKLADILDERSGMVKAEIVSARPLSEALKGRLEEKVRELTGKQPRLNFATDESLLGGVVTKIGSTIYDASVRNELDRLREVLAG